MGQDEAYHRALDEAGRHLHRAENGVNNADSAKRQRQKIIKEQVPPLQIPPPKNKRKKEAECVPRNVIQ